MYLYIFYIILIIIIILYFINKNIKENFVDISGDITTVDPGIVPVRNCDPGTSCETLIIHFLVFFRVCLDFVFFGI